MIIETLVGSAIKQVLTGGEFSIPTLNKMTKADADKLASAVAVTLAKDPVVINEMNSEPLPRSRVVVGSTAALAGAVATILTFIWPDGGDWQAIASAIVTLAGAGMALYGRLMPNLKPMWG